MRLYVSGITKSLRREIAKSPDSFGFLTSPSAGNKVATICSFDVPWAIDNGAFTGFDPMKFHLLITRAIYAERKPEWVVCPDVVADAKATLVMFRAWINAIFALKLNAAFVAQDGQENLELPSWHLWTCLFIGGSTKFKLSRAAAELVEEAKLHGKTVHMGRVNSFKRLRHAHEIGCDSVDGTGMSRWGDRHLRKFCGWLSQLDEQPLLSL